MKRPAPSAFREHEGGMSTDWAKYRTPAQTLAAARIPNDNGVIRLIVGQVRQIPLQVTHTPIVVNVLIGAEAVSAKLFPLEFWQHLWGNAKGKNPWSWRERRT